MTAPTPVRRRGVLEAGLAAVAATMLAPGLAWIELKRDANAAAGPDLAARRWGLLIDVARCEEGCAACAEACSREHGWHAEPRGDADPRWLRVVTATEPSSGRAVRLPLMCQHCAQPPCADVCPTAATFRRADGVVLVDRHRCIGCRYCVMACPFGARFFLGDDVYDRRAHSPRGKGTAEGCTLCVHRLDRGQPPACVEACANAGGAMTFGDLNDPRSPVRAALARTPATPLRDDLALDPGVRYRNV